VPDAVGRLKVDGRIAYVEPNYIVRAVDVFPNDPRFVDQWNLHNIGQTGGEIDADIDAPQAWVSETGGDVLVGVIDTGVDLNHIDLADNIFVNSREIPDNRVDDDRNGFIDDVHGWDFVNEDNNPDDDNGHGTHIAGTIAAVGNNGVGVTGVSWSARIMPLKFLGSVGTGSISNAILAIEYATMMGARVTNNSWGGADFSQALRDAIQAAANANIVFVAAAGNTATNTDIAPHYPSGFELDNIISVTGTDHSDQRSIFSNYGATSVDLGAPGSDIVSTFTNDRYAIASGTSMAAPHVAGAVCLLWSAAPLLTAAEVKNTILSTVDPLPSLQGFTVTGGRLNVGAMLASLDDVPPSPVVDLSVVSTGSNSALLAWTAPGDDGSDGSASRYDLRHSVAPIDADNFELATPVTGTPAPKPAGSHETFEVAGLKFETSYYFALIVEDEGSNRSPLSNVASGTTLGIPRLKFVPGSFAADLLTGGRSVQVLTVKNVGEGTLDFSFARAPRGDKIATDIPLPSWLRANPEAGRVHAGESASVEFTFDATHLSGGDYYDTVLLQTNDPAQASAPLAFSLRVTSAPDIASSPLELDYGVRYTGTCTTDTVLVTNIGAEALVVSGLAILNPEFSVETLGFVLAVEESRAVAVTFCPVAEEMTPGIPRRYPRRSRAVLTVATNDPDHPVYAVPLFGDGIDPPVVSVSPSSFDEDLVTGAVATRTLTVSNSGTSDLDFEITVEEVGGLGVRIDVTADPSASPNVVAAGRPLGQDEIAALTAEVPRTITIGSRAGVDKGSAFVRREESPRVLERMSIDNLEEVFGNDQNEFLGGPRTRGNLFACTKPTTLREHRFFVNPTVPTQMWFMVYEGEEQSGVYQLISASDVTPAGPGLGWYSSGPIAVQLRAGRFYLIAAAFEDPATYYNQQDIAPFPIPASFGDLIGAAGWTWQPADQFPPAPLQFVAPDAFGEPVAYYQTLVTGGAIRWLSLDQEAGRVPPDGSLDIPVQLDATGVPGGDYQATLHITSNDPATPEVTIPARVHVTGAPDITVSESEIDFGTSFVGTSSQDTLIVTNSGTDFLFVSSIASTDPAYTVDAPRFALTPGTRKLVVVTFAPTGAGILPATLSIASIDPDESVIEIVLHGEAKEAPVAIVAPVSFAVDLESGEAESRTLTISNPGGSDLEFEVETALGAPRVRSTRVRIPHRSGDFPRGIHPPSIGPAPVSKTNHRPTDLAPARASAIGNFAFATETQNLQAARLRLDAPETLEFVGAARDLIWAGDFGIGDNSFAYAVNELNQFVKIDTLTGAQTPLGTLPPVGNEAWSGMALDPTEGVMYAASTNARESSLYTIDVDGPSATRIGSIFSPAVVAIAVDDDGKLFALDVINDLLLAVDKSTGVGTTIGSLGFDSNFGQGMAFDPVSEQLYISAFNNFRFQSELRIADRITGATTVVGVLGGLDPGGLVQLGWLGIPGLGGVPWLRAGPRRGIVAPGASLDVEVVFNADHLIGGDYDAHLHVLTNDPATPSFSVPAHARVVGIPDIAASDSLLEFGPVFIGGSSRKMVSVSNVGTDVLHIAGVSASGDYATNGTPSVLAPGEHRDVAVTLAPTTAGELIGSLVITSDDVDQGTIEIVLRGEGREPPVMWVTPSSFEEDLMTGQSVTRSMTIDNSAGAADLVWNAAARFAGDARAVIATSPERRSRPRVDLLKESGLPPVGRPHASTIFAFAHRAVSAPAPVDATSLETILESLDAHAADVSAAIPNRWDFFDGKVSDGILDGGYDMFDGGNYLSTNLGGFIPYSDGVIASSSYFGANGRYFTRKYTGLFVLVAELDGVEHFEINGNLGADGFGSADGAILEARTAGADFRGFVKRVYGAGDPSVNHMIIVQENDAASHEFATDTNSDYHRAVNLSSGRRLYYLLYSGWDGAYIDNAAALNIMATFLNSIGLAPGWVRVTPGAGVVPAGASAALSVVFDATGVAGDHEADVVVAGNDPITPEVAIPARLRAAAAPDVEVSSLVMTYAPIFVGATALDTLTVFNRGTDVLVVTDVASSAPEFAVDATSFSIPLGQSKHLQVTFAPAASGWRTGSLAIASNDFDEASVIVFLIGEGLDAPAVSVSPASLSDTLMSGTSSTHALTVFNNGGNTLDLRITAEGARVPEARALTSTIVSGGGPDFFGYRWEDSNDPDGPAFEWIDASGGSNIALAGDDFVTGIPLGFAFRYYGSVFAEIGVGSNGWLSFNGSGGGYPTQVPTPDFFAGAIAPYARDLVPPGGNYVRYQTVGVAPDRRFVVEYNAIPDLEGGNSKTFEVIFYERTNSIRFQYLVAPNAPEGFGIESPDESLGMGNGGAGQTFIDPARVEDGYAIEFLAPPSWLTVEPTDASVPPGGSADFVVTIRADELEGGNYDARLAIRSNDPVTPLLVVAVSLAVSAPVSITGIDSRVVPTRYQLHANRPNPFNPTTTIAYDLPRSGHVRLVIYDVRGKEVAQLVSANQPAGRHVATWDGRSAKSEPAASGVYFYRLEAGDFVQTKKMVLLK